MGVCVCVAVQSYASDTVDFSTMSNIKMWFYNIKICFQCECAFFLITIDYELKLIIIICKTLRTSHSCWVKFETMNRRLSIKLENPKECVDFVATSAHECVFHRILYPYPFLKMMVVLSMKICKDFLYLFSCDVFES